MLDLAEWEFQDFSGVGERKKERENRGQDPSGFPQGLA
jgi:hypothetical protein